MRENPVLYTDISKKSIKSPSGDLVNVDNEMSVLEVVSNVLVRQRGFGAMDDCDLGCDLDRYLFEPIDNLTAKDIVDEIENALEFETRIQNLQIVVTPDPDNNTFQIDLTFELDISPGEITFSTALDKLR